MITAASYLKSEQLDSQTYRVILHITDDSAPAYDLGMVVHGQTVADLRDDATRQIVAINASLTTKNVLAGIAPGTAIPIALAAAPAPTAQQTFFSDLAKWERIQDAIAAGIVDAAAAEVVAFKTQVKSEYQAAFLPAF